MKLKLDADGHVVVEDGKPVYVKDDGTDVAFDAPGTLSSITRLNGEAKSHRERAETAEAGLKNFAGIEDPAAALAALQTVANLDGKKLIDANEAERFRLEAVKGETAKRKAAEKERDDAKTQLSNELVGGQFARSKFIAEKLAVPADMIQATFGSKFTIENGKVFGLDAAGQKLISPSNPGEFASFDEALEMHVNSYAHKDTILKGSGQSGSGAQGAGGAQGGGRTVSRSEFAKLDPAAAASTAAEVRSGIVTITD